jgi:predicted TIM-barrel fold metal-dependent hydrolase
MDYRVVDADSHINNPPDAWKGVPAKYRDRAPRLVDMGGYDGWAVEDRPPTPLAALSFAAGKKPEEIGRRRIRFAEQAPGCWDPTARLEALDRDGIDAQVLYGDGTGQAQDPELRIALVHAYNEFLAEFVAVAPQRYIGLAIVPMDDPEAAVREVERSRRLGLRGLFIGLDGADFPITAPQYDRFWAAAAAEGLPVSIHIGGGAGIKRSLVHATDVAPGTLEAFLTLAPMSVGHTLGMLIFGEVFVRHPGLRVVIAEGGIGWMAYFLERIDAVFEKQRFWAQSKLSERPSTFFRQHVFVTFEEDVAGMRTYDLIGADRIMWASDYPHSDTTYPNSRRAIEKHFGHVPAADRDAMTCANAASLYGLVPRDAERAAHPG